MMVSCLVIGLGNPGRQYRQNRHNLGFMVVDQLAAALQVHFSRQQSRALIASAIYQGCRIILAKPQTFMNLSGGSVRGLVRFYKLEPENLMVAHDDLDLPLGSIRIRPDGGSAGHKGLASILEYMQTDAFARLRLGIGRPPGQMDPPDYVLQDFSKDESLIVAETLKRAVEATLMWVTDGLETAMNKFNGVVS
jgi:PTH1 family peptidyl-tRNA hydrolase